jgi:hypothetical protein
MTLSQHLHAKRQAKADKRATRAIRRQVRPVVKPLPALFDCWTVFEPVDRIIDQLRTGEVHTVDGVPAYQDANGQWHELCPPLAGWISCWQRFDQALNLGLDLNALRVVHHCVERDELLEPAEVDDAVRCVDLLRALFPQLPRKRLTELARTEQIALYAGDIELTE